MDDKIPDYIKDNMQLTNFLQKHPGCPVNEFIATGNSIAQRVILEPGSEGDFYISQICKCRTPEWATKIAAALNNKTTRADRIEHTLCEFVGDVESTGGVSKKNSGPAAATDWTDLGRTYVRACEALGIEPIRIQE